MPSATLEAPQSIVDRRAFARDGIAGPIRIMGPEQCRALVRYLSGTQQISAPVWPKGRATSDGILARVAAHPALISLLVPVLGEDVILWGASLVRAAAGRSHPWHSDIESCRPEGGFVSAWLGLENVNEQSTLRFVSGSHLVGESVQEFRDREGVSRSELRDEQVLAWAQRANSDASLIEVPASNGEVILFDGRIWHGSENRLPDGERTALLLQFASAETPVRIPVLDNLKWPFRYLDSPRPPVLAVHGDGRPDLNEVVQMPAYGPPKRRRTLASSIHSLDLEPSTNAVRYWQPYPQFRGRTAALDLMSCHAAMLQPGISPHPPHAHQDEELLVVLDGEADLLVADRADFKGATAIPVKTGDFAYYPAFQHHTIRNKSSKPVRYLMFRWNRSEATAPSGKLKAFVVQDPVRPESQDGRGFSVRTIFEGRTQWLRKFHCHSTRLEPGSGYAPHADAYDVAILMQSGRVQTLGRSVGPGELIFYPAGELHGMRNIGDVPAFYLVFEWHGAPVAGTSAGVGTTPPIALAR